MPMNLPQIYLSVYSFIGIPLASSHEVPINCGWYRNHTVLLLRLLYGCWQPPTSGILFKCDYSSNCCRYCCSSEDSGYLTFHWGIYVCDWPHLILSIVNWKRLNSGGAIQRNSLFRWNGQRIYDRNLLLRNSLQCGLH